VLKALAAQYRTTLRRPERNRSFFSALGAVCASLGLSVGVRALRSMRRRGSQNRHSFALTVLAAFRFVLKLLVVEKQLFTRREHEIRATIDTLENLVLVFH
jgi:hypothetical protein